jgi:hypothetical protein
MGLIQRGKATDSGFFDDMVLKRIFRHKRGTYLSQARRDRKESLQEATQCYVTTRLIFFVSQAFAR